METAGFFIIMIKSSWYKVVNYKNVFSKFFVRGCRIIVLCLLCLFTSGELISQIDDPPRFKYYGEFDISLKFNFVEYLDKNGNVIKYKNTQSSVLISPSNKYILLTEDKMSIKFEIEEISYMFTGKGKKFYASLIKLAGVDMGLLGWDSESVIWMQADKLTIRFINIK